MNPKIFRSKKIWGQKQFFWLKIFGSKKILGEKKFWVKKFLSQKKFGGQKNFGVKNFFVFCISGRFFFVPVNKNFVPKNFSNLKFRQLFFWMNNFSWPKFSREKCFLPKPLGQNIFEHNFLYQKLFFDRKTFFYLKSILGPKTLFDAKIFFDP